MRHFSPFVIAYLFVAAGTSPAWGAWMFAGSENDMSIGTTGEVAFDLSALTLVGTEDGRALIDPSSSIIATGSPSTTVLDVYSPIRPPTNFGPGGMTIPSFGTGPTIRLDATSLAVPSGYISGTPLHSSVSFYPGETPGSLGLTPGIYVWSWGAESTAETLTLTVVPEPSTLCLLLIGLVVGGFFRIRKKVRNCNHTNALPP